MTRYFITFLRYLMLAVCLPCAGVLAGALQISPVSVTLPAGEQAVLLTLKSQSERPVRWQLRLFRWTQSEGRDQLIPSDAIAISPPAVTLAPGLSYNIRLVRIQPASSPEQEEAYRLLIDELPDVADPRAVGKGLTLLLRASVPVFVAPEGAVPRLTIRRITGDSGQPGLLAGNAGTLHALMSEVVLTDGRERWPLSVSTLNGYILPGQQRFWPFPPQARRCLNSVGCTVSARVNGRPEQYRVQP